MSGKRTSEESTTVTVDQTFSDSELKYFQKLECTIHNAFLEVNEFALYSVLETLLGMYADSFPTLERLDSKTFIHVTPQDILTGSMRVCSISGEERFRMIPDATVRITRLYPGQDKRDHHMVLVIEAKRLVPVLCGRRKLQWNTSEAVEKAEEDFPRHIPQLMLQACFAWPESLGQQCLYVGILIGPYLTVMVFNHPPRDQPIRGEDVRSICDAFPQGHAPRLVAYMKHILENPEDWRVGLSVPLQHIFRLATKDVVNRFEPEITQQPSRTFSFKGDPHTSYAATAADEFAFSTVIEELYNKSKLNEDVRNAIRADEDYHDDPDDGDYVERAHRRKRKRAEVDKFMVLPS